MPAMDFQPLCNTRLRRKSIQRQYPFHTFRVIISKSWLVWTHHLIVIINEKVNGKSPPPLSGASDSLLINLRSFPLSPLFVFSFIKRGTFWVHVFLFYFLLYPTPQKSSAPDSSGSPSTLRGESEMTSGKRKFLYAFIPAQRFSKCCWR